MDATRQTDEEAAREAARKSKVHSAQLEAVFHAMSDGVLVFGMNGQLLFLNDAEARIHGFADAGEMERLFAQRVAEAPPPPVTPSGATPPIFSSVIRMEHPDGSVVPFEDWPSSRAIRGEALTGMVLKMSYIFREQSRFFSFNTAPIMDTDGKQVLALVVTRDVTEQRRIEDELREADRRKGEFLGVLSHELRNPLASIRNSVHLLRLAPPGSTHAARAADVIERQTEHLTRIVDDLLDVTRISKGKIELERARVDLREVVSQTGEDHASLFEDAELDLRIDPQTEPVWVDVDRTRIAQVVGNLLHNAAKYTPRGGRVEVAVVRQGQRAVISVQDTGIGIEPATLEELFTPFTQARQTLARTQGGLGLGLSLVRALVELHGGSVRAHSEGLGKGSEFAVELPLAPGGDAARLDLDELTVDETRPGVHGF